jgi:hypothetical protein
MKTTEIRQIIKNLPRIPNIAYLHEAPVIHSGFPSCFNLSFGEYELLREFNGQYLVYDHDCIYSKIQPCIRHQDWETIVKDEKNRWRYLSLFNMADVSGLIIKQNNKEQEELGKHAIFSFVHFIVSLGLKKENLRISYFAGGKVRDVTKGKYELETYIPSDPLKDYWKTLGISENQFISDATRDTFLALQVFGLPTPWGYRNEINYLHDGKLLDIGTVEYMKFEPVFVDKKIIALKPFRHSLGISAVGVERLLMIINNHANVYDIDIIEPLIHEVLERCEKKDKIQAMIIVQAIRALHQIISDGGIYSRLNTRRKEYVRMFCRDMVVAAKKINYNLSPIHIKKILQLNAKLQLFYPQLLNNIEITGQEIQARINQLYNKNM